MSDTVTLYFSFRSPYSWLGFHRARRYLPGLGIATEHIAVFPPEGTTVASSGTPTRMAYLTEDVERMARAYGLGVCWPEVRDTDWVRAHACFYAAADAGRGEELIAAAYEARFGRGEDLGDRNVLTCVAQEAGVEAETILAAAGDEAFHGRVWQGMSQARDAGVFGVPFFVYKGRKFWGNDRLEWLLRAIEEDRGQVVPDLEENLLGVPCTAP